METLHSCVIALKILQLRDGEPLCLDVIANLGEFSHQDPGRYIWCVCK